jgi:hypothetical protein
MRPGQLLAAATCAGWGLCVAGLLVGRWLDAQIRQAVTFP